MDGDREQMNKKKTKKQKKTKKNSNYNKILLLDGYFSSLLNLLIQIKCLTHTFLCLLT